MQLLPSLSLKRATNESKLQPAFILPWMLLISFKVTFSLFYCLCVVVAVSCLLPFVKGFVLLFYLAELVFFALVDDQIFPVQTN